MQECPLLGIGIIEDDSIHSILSRKETLLKKMVGGMELRLHLPNWFLRQHLWAGLACKEMTHDLGNEDQELISQKLMWIMPPSQYPREWKLLPFLLALRTEDPTGMGMLTPDK